VVILNAFRNDGYKTVIIVATSYVHGIIICYTVAIVVGGHIEVGTRSNCIFILTVVLQSAILPIYITVTQSKGSAATLTRLTMKSWKVALDRIQQLRDYAEFKLTLLQKEIGGDIMFTDKNQPYIRRRGYYPHDIMYNAMKDNYRVFYLDSCRRRHIVDMERTDIVNAARKRMQLMIIG
jgi:hypothetical protein